jgi:fatty-acyl-CoA synthase
MSLRDRLEKVGFAARVVSRTGLLGSLTPGGFVKFVRSARGTKPGPHLTLLLHALNNGDGVALSDERRRITWAELNYEVNQLARGLASLGVGAGDRVAIMMRNCCEYIIVQHAATRIGATVVQIGYRLKPKEIAYILENSAPKACLYHTDYAAFMEEARESAGLPLADNMIATCTRSGPLTVGTRYEEFLAGRDGDSPPGEYSDEGGVMVYTSGTTGKPKGATRSAKDTGLESVGDMMVKVGMTSQDRHLIVCPLYHSGAFGFYSVMSALGAPCVTIEHFDEKFVFETIQRERITSAFMVPTMLARLAAVDEKMRSKYDLSSLRWICSGAAPLPTETARRFMAVYGPILYNFYGATETGFVTLAGPDDHVAHPGTIGKLLRGNRIRIIGDDGTDVAPGEVGELYTSNEMLIGGYHENKTATDKAMLDGYFSVGDLARVDSEGFVYLQSRKSDMVISGGVNIYPREIEDHLVTHPDILEAAVIGVPDEKWGESLKAYIVPSRPGAVTTEDVISYCHESLAGYKRPRHVEFLDSLPRNPTGKVLKRELRERHATTDQPSA